MRDDVVQHFPNFVTFVEKEWEMQGAQGQKRAPWPRGSTVRVKSAGRFHDHSGVVEAFRCLVIPWFGYDVRFEDGQRHFFHERDLSLVESKTPH
jgi:hypothetical protein